MKNKPDINDSYLRIRKLIGFLGLLLPILVVAFYGKFLPSISIYYYTRSAVFFIAILAAFGLFLISYIGYDNTEKEKEWWKFSDNAVTHVGGFAILFVVLFPTSCTEDKSSICQLCCCQSFCLFGHTSSFINTIHLVSAALFFAAMGYMSIFNFTRGSDKKYHFMFKLCGWIIWISLILLFIFMFAFKKYFIGTNIVYIMETIMISAFAISWLLKGKTLEYIGSFFKKSK